MDRNDGSITEIFFLLEVCLLGLLEVACIGWRSITETFLASLEIWAFVWVACMRWAWLALVITEMNRNDRSITEIFFLLEGLAGAFGGRLFGLEEHYRNYSLSLIFCYGKKKKTSFLFTCS